VTEVELCIDATDGPPMVSSIKIHRGDGGSFTLPAPGVQAEQPALVPVVGLALARARRTAGS